MTGWFWKSVKRKKLQGAELLVGAQAELQPIVAHAYGLGLAFLVEFVTHLAYRHIEQSLYALALGRHIFQYVDLDGTLRGSVDGLG